MKNLILIGLMLIAFGYSPTYSQTAPTAYWHFDGGTPYTSNVGGVTLNKNGYTSTIAAGGTVGNYLDMSRLIDHWHTGGNFDATNGFTIQSCIRVGRNFAKVRNSTLFKLGESHYMGLEWPYITFRVTALAGEREFKLKLDLDSTKSWSYLTDGNWHHIAFVYKTTGSMEIWIDGQSPASFKHAVAAGDLYPGGGIALSWTDYTSYYGGYDELAVYETDLTDEQIYQNYEDAMISGVHYQTALAGAVPAAYTHTTDLDTMEYAPLSTLPTVGDATVSGGLTALQQLQDFPTPRYNPRYKMPPNMNWADITYLGGKGIDGTNATTIATGVAINIELAKRWNYYIQAAEGIATGTLSPSVYTNTTTSWAGALAKCANDYPTLPAAVITFRAQLNGNSPYIWKTNLDASAYLKDGSSRYLDINGNVTTNPATRIWNPLGHYSLWQQDGDTVKAGLQLLMNYLPARPATRKLDLINENAEVIPAITPQVFTKSPELVNAASSAGMNLMDYIASKYSANVGRQSYRDRFMGLPGLSGTKFTEYNLCGHTDMITGQYDFAWKWSKVRDINTSFSGLTRHSTPDVYVRYPDNWKTGITAWHGLDWLIVSRYEEFFLGDTLFSPFVSAGWDPVEENNVRPAQWLGLLKCMMMYGANFYYTGYFNLGSPFAEPKNWVWQMVMPSYAQATGSRLQNYLKNGYLMPGDVPRTYITTQVAYPGYSFYGGNYNKMIIARKVNQGSTYAIMGTIQPVSNYKNTTNLADTATIVIDNKTLKINIRRQGSTYIYDPTSVATEPVFYQVDAWHESYHPYYWSKKFEIEAEIFDNHSPGRVIKNDLTAENLSGDWTSFTAYAQMLDPKKGLVYYFTPRDTNPNYYVWVRARVQPGISTTQRVNLNVNGLTQQKVSVLVTGSTWTWYSVNTTGARIKFSNLSANIEHRLRLYGNTKVQIDKIVITPNIGDTYP